MKQLIVLVSTIMLGITISGLITGFGTAAGQMTDSTMSSLNSVIGITTSGGGVGGN